MMDGYATLVFNLNGGRGSIGEVFTRGDAVFPIPATSPTRDGYLFSGWSEDGANPISGDTVSVASGQTKTLTALWRRNDLEFSAQGELFLPYCGIRIFRSPNVVFNATFYQMDGGFAVIKKAENRPGNATFTLSNDYRDPTKILLADTFAQWESSDGEVPSPHAVEVGMYVQLLNIVSESEGDILMDGYITTITPNAESVQFEVADQITMASKAGSTLRRNFRGESANGSVFVSMRQTADRTLSADLSSLGTILSVRRLDTGDPTAFPTLNTDQWSNRNCGLVVASDIIASPSQIRARSAKVSFECYLRQPSNWLKNYDRLFTFNVEVKGLNPGEGYRGVATHSVHTPRSSVSTNYYHVNFDVDIPLSGSNVLLANNIHMDINVSIDFDGEKLTYDDGCMVRAASVSFDSYSEITPSQQIVIENAPDNMLADPSNRLYVTYLSSTQSISALRIMEGISSALGWGFETTLGMDIETDSAKLALYRVGGAYAQDYLQKLADLVSSDGHKLSYEITGMSPTLRVGRRASPTDAPVMTIAYAGDNVEGATPFSDCKVGLTFKNRPNLITMRANVSSEITNSVITVSMEDPYTTETRGRYIESILADTTFSNIDGIGQALYGGLKASDLDNWEGTVIIPGIVPFMNEGLLPSAGSGKAVRLIDSRIGLDAVVVVKQAEYDFQNCVTRLTVGNYSAVYSNAISSTNALALCSVDAFSAVSDTSLYFQQSVYLKGGDTVWNVPSDPTMFVFSQSRQKWISFGTPKVFKLPPKNGQRWALVVATSTASAGDGATADYDISLVGLSGYEVTYNVNIDRSIRPDFYLGQTLTVCVMARIPLE